MKHLKRTKRDGIQIINKNFLEFVYIHRNQYGLTESYSPKKIGMNQSVSKKEQHDETITVYHNGYKYAIIGTYRILDIKEIMKQVRLLKIIEHIL